jgi:hypothetical protein
MQLTIQFGPAVRRALDGVAPDSWRSEAPTTAVGRRRNT